MLNPSLQFTIFHVVLVLLFLIRPLFLLLILVLPLHHFQMLKICWPTHPFTSLPSNIVGDGGAVVWNDAIARTITVRVPSETASPPTIRSLLKWNRHVQMIRTQTAISFFLEEPSDETAMNCRLGFLSLFWVFFTSSLFFFRAAPKEKNIHLYGRWYVWMNVPKISFFHLLKHSLATLFRRPDWDTLPLQTWSCSEYHLRKEAIPSYQMCPKILLRKTCYGILKPFEWSLPVECFRKKNRSRTFRKVAANTLPPPEDFLCIFPDIWETLCKSSSR